MTTPANEKRNATTIERSLDTSSAAANTADNGIAADNDYFNLKMEMVTVDCIDDGESHIIGPDVGVTDDEVNHAGWIVMTAPARSDGINDDDDDEDDGVDSDVDIDYPSGGESDPSNTHRPPHHRAKTDEFELIDK